MRARMLTDRSDADLLRNLAAIVVRDRENTAELLAHIAEVDARRLYVPAGFASMHAYCVGELRFSEESAYKRIQAARAARRVPALLAELVAGRLHLTAICLLAPYLTPENADELIEVARHRSKSWLATWLVRRFFEPGLLALPDRGSASTELDPDPVGPAIGVDVHFVVDREKLEYARALLSHAIPSGDLGKLFDRALDAVIREQEKRKLGFAAQPRTAERRRPSSAPRHVPAHAKREVWRRDEGRCTFVGRDGHRCGARRFLEFDHVRPVALGGKATVEDLRLRCRAHNQYEAERVFGQEFIAQKREAARRAHEEKAREAGESRRARDAQADRALGPPCGTHRDERGVPAATNVAKPVGEPEVAVCGEAKQGRAP